jgi:hypothetical protein
LYDWYVNQHKKSNQSQKTPDPVGPTVMSRESRRELLVFSLLLSFGVFGRWAQPTWEFTPLAAVTALGGYYFRNWLPAVLLPCAILAVTNLTLPAHDNLLVPVTVYASMALVPLALGRAARGTAGWQRAFCWGLCGFAPATTFFLVTNFAVWMAKSLYAPTWAGLVECYARALPFYRAMLAGDMCYVSLMVACLVAAQLWERRTLAWDAARK